MKQKLLLLLCSVFITAAVNAQQFQDTIRYTYLKEALVGTNTFFTFAVWHTDNEAFSQAFLLSGASMTIKGAEIYGKANTSAPVVMRASVYNVNASFKPTTLITSGTVTVNAAADYYAVNFDSPATVTGNYAIVIDVITSGGILDVYVTNTVAKSYDEPYSSFRSTYYPKSQNAFVDIATLTTGDPANFPARMTFEVLISPIVSYEIISQASVSTTSSCITNAVTFTGTAGPEAILENRMYNYQVFRKHFGLAIADSTYFWETGEGENYKLGKSVTYTYPSAGTYMPSFHVAAGLWAGANQPIIKTVEIFQHPAPVISEQPRDTVVTKGRAASFAIISEDATQFQWQVKSGPSFVNIIDDDNYSGTNTSVLQIASASTIMNHYKYRCVVSGECTKNGVSTEAVITVNLKLPQIIVFANTASKGYSDEPFYPGAVSDAALTVSYSSSDNSIAKVENGKVTILKAGAVTITASQQGDEIYADATPKAQVLTIAPKEITVSLTNSKPVSKVYDASVGAFLTSSNYILHGIINDDIVTVSGTGEYDNINVGNSKTVTVDHFVLSGAQNSNYILKTTSATVTASITPKELTVMLNSSPSVTKIYDGSTTAQLDEANVVLTGVINNDVVNLVGTATYEDANAGENKIITFGNISVTGAAASNYILNSTVATTTGTIHKKQISVSANNQVKLYGASDPELTFTATGLIGDDELPGKLVRRSGDNCGLYTIEHGNLSGGTNYIIQHFTTAELKINPSPLVITVDKKIKKQGEINPVFNFSYSGFVNGDGADDLQTLPLAITTAELKSPIGNYPIRVSGATSQNYSISYVDGILSVMPAAGKSNLKAWSSSASSLEIRVAAVKPESAKIMLTNLSGQPVQILQKSLQAGINYATMHVGNLTPGMYVIHVGTGSMKESQQVKIK